MYLRNTLSEVICYYRYAFFSAFIKLVIKIIQIIIQKTSNGLLVIPTVWSVKISPEKVLNDYQIKSSE